MPLCCPLPAELIHGTPPRPVPGGPGIAPLPNANPLPLAKACKNPPLPVANPCPVAGSPISVIGGAGTNPVLPKDVGTPEAAVLLPDAAAVRPQVAGGAPLLIDVPPVPLSAVSLPVSRRGPKDAVGVRAEALGCVGVAVEAADWIV